MKITQEIDIKKSSQEVFNFISNFENNPKWQQGMKTCTIIDNKPLGLDQEYEQEAAFLGKSILSRFVVIQYEPGHLVKAIVEGDSSKFFKLLEPLMKFMVKSSIKKDYYRLKTLLEQ